MRLLTDLFSSTITGVKNSNHPQGNGLDCGGVAAYMI
jgi:hypothetical protein